MAREERTRPYAGDVVHRGAVPPSPPVTPPGEFGAVPISPPVTPATPPSPPAQPITPPPAQK